MVAVPGRCCGSFRSAHWVLMCLQTMWKTIGDASKCWCGQGTAQLQLCHRANDSAAYMCCLILHQWATTPGSSELCVCCKQTNWTCPVHTEAENPPPSCTISNSLCVPEAWGLNGGGEKRLNEHSEEYLQLPPLTWTTTVVIGRHPYGGTSLLLRLPPSLTLYRRRTRWGTGEERFVRLHHIKREKTMQCTGNTDV